MHTEDRTRILEGFEEQRQQLARECPDEIAGSYRNQEETMALGLASSDESRIRILAGLAIDDKVDPNNGLFFFDLAPHFVDPTRVKDAQRVAQYHQLPTHLFGKAERMLRRIMHPSLNRYVSIR